MSFAKFLRIPFFTKHLWWLLLALEIIVRLGLILIMIVLIFGGVRTDLSGVYFAPQEKKYEHSKVASISSKIHIASVISVTLQIKRHCIGLRLAYYHMCYSKSNFISIQVMKYVM